MIKSCVLDQGKEVTLCVAFFDISNLKAFHYPATWRNLNPYLIRWLKPWLPIVLDRFHVVLRNWRRYLKQTILYQLYEVPHARKYTIGPLLFVVLLLPPSSPVVKSLRSDVYEVKSAWVDTLQNHLKIYLFDCLNSPVHKTALPSPTSQV